RLKRAMMEEVAVLRPVAVPLAVAVDPEIVVPLQVIGMHVLEEAHELAEEPRVRGVIDQADLRRQRMTGAGWWRRRDLAVSCLRSVLVLVWIRRFAVWIVRVVQPVGRREKSFLRRAGQADGRAVDPFRFHP